MVPDKLDSVAKKPLAGRRIVITRARSQASGLASAIEALGGEVVEFPTIEIVPPKSYDSLDLAIRHIESYQWVIFTSVNGVAQFLARFRFLKREIDVLKGVKIAAIGPETARALGDAQLHVDLMPEEYRAEGILQELRPGDVKGKRVLLPRAAEARAILPKTLREWGADVHVVEAYRTLPAKNNRGLLQTLLLNKGIDMVTFTSSSTVSHFAALFPGDNVAELLRGTAVACIGPITRERAEQIGIGVDVVPRDYTIPGLVQAIVEYFNSQGLRAKG